MKKTKSKPRRARAIGLPPETLGKKSKKTLGQPYGDRVLVKPAAVQEQTSFGLIIPDSTKEKPEQGVVVAVGPGRKGNDGKLVPLSVKVGDKIMFSTYDRNEVKIDGTEYYLIKEESITYIF